MGDPNEVDSEQYARVRFSYLPVLLPRDGPVIAQLGRQWAVFVYAEWENWFRGRVAAARGCDKDDVQVSVFGDLRLIRHDILHCGAVAKKSAGQQCEVLRWFEAGEAIVINERHVADFMKSVPWHDLREG